MYDVDSLEEKFDFVLFFGLYYHLTDIVLALKKIYSVVNESVFLAGHILDSKDPIMYLNDSKPHGGWFASSECLLQIGEKIGSLKNKYISYGIWC